MDIDKALAYLTLDEKLRMLSGDGMWHTFGAGELPRVRMSDGPNGLRMTEYTMTSAVPATCFPTLSMLANSFDPALLYSVGACIGREATAMGVNLLLAPGVNIKRNPLGGRNFEYFSEDPLLAGEMGKAYISGVQSTGVGACVKHFAANNQEDRRMYSDSVVDARALREIYLKPFEIALQAQPAAVMCAYNKLNGEYCSQNEYLLTTVLRDEWNYDGVVVSDWGAVRDRAKALNAGLDLAMPDSGGLFEQQLLSAFDGGEITEETVDRSLRRLLKLTDDVYLEPYGDFDADAHDRLAYNAAAASLVMLRNIDRFLPLTRDMKIAAVGELASSSPICGGGSSYVSALRRESHIDAMTMRGVNFKYLQGYDSDPKLNQKLCDEAVKGSADCDAVVVFVGGPTPAEGVDRTSLDLPPEQDKLISALTAAGRRVVVVLCSAAPVRMPWINRVRAVLYSGLNGQSGALAAIDALFGRINPCGKLAETFPTALIDGDVTRDFGGDMPLYRESIFVGYRYYDAIERRPLFPFGHGLSFCDVSYDGMRVKRLGGAQFDVEITLTNNSVRDANEIVQVYVSDRTGRVMCARKQLAGFSKVFIEGQTTTSTTIHLTPKAFEFFDDKKNKFRIADGEYKILVGASAGDIKHEISVKVDGDYTEHVPVPQSYVTPSIKDITDDDFALVLGRPLPKPPAPPQKGEYTLDCCINDVKGTLIGKIVAHAALKRAKHVGKANSPERAAFVAMMLNTPLSSASAMSDGAMPLKTAKGILKIANGELVAGLKLILKKQKQPAD